MKILKNHKLWATVSLAAALAYLFFAGRCIYNLYMLCVYLLDFLGYILIGRSMQLNTKNKNLFIGTIFLAVAVLVNLIATPPAYRTSLIVMLVVNCILVYMTKTVVDGKAINKTLSYVMLVITGFDIVYALINLFSGFAIYQIFSLVIAIAGFGLVFWLTDVDVEKTVVENKKETPADTKENLSWMLAREEITIEEYDRRMELLNSKNN